MLIDCSELHYRSKPSLINQVVCDSPRQIQFELKLAFLK